MQTVQLSTFIIMPPPMHRKNATPLQLSTIFSLSLDFVDVCARFFYPSQFV